MGRDSNIYGADDNNFAEGVASDALSNTAGSYIWGGLKDARADSWDGTKDPQEGDPDVLAGNKAGAGDDGKMDWNYDSKLPRHRTVKSSPDESTFTAPKRFSGK